MEIPPPLIFPHPSHSIHLSIVSKIGGLNSSGDKNQKQHGFSHAQHSSFFICHSSSVIRHSSLFILTPSTEGGHIITNFDNPYFSEGAICYLVGSKHGDLTVLATNRRKNHHTPSSKTLKHAKDSILPYHHFSLYAFLVWRRGSLTHVSSVTSWSTLDGKYQTFLVFQKLFLIHRVHLTEPSD